MRKATTIRKPNVTTQALPGFDYDVLVMDGPARPDVIQPRMDQGWEFVGIGSAPANQTQIVIRKRRNGLHPDTAR